jgi:hypothetical protein
MAQQESAAPSDADRALTETQNWGARSHRELYDSVHTDNDPGRVGELAQEWTRLGQQIGESAQSMSERLRSTEAGWQGEAAAAARHAIQQLADWSRTAGETASALGARIADQGRIMEVAKASMPEPVESDHPARTYASNDLAGFAKATADAKVQHDQANAAHQQAVTVMTRMETDSRAVDGNTPQFTPPPNPIHDAPQQSPRTQANPDGRHLATTRSAWANQPGNNSPVGEAGPGNTSPLAGNGNQPGGQQQAAGSGSAEAVVPPPSAFSPGTSSAAEATTRAVPVNDKQQGGTSGGDAKSRPVVAEDKQHGDARGGGANTGGTAVDHHRDGGATGHADTRAASADHAPKGADPKGEDPKGEDPNTRVPTLEDRQPSSTTSQGVQIASPQTPNPSGEHQVPPRSPQIPVPGGSAVGGGPRAGASRGASGSGSASTGWSGSLKPPPPSTPGGATSASSPPGADNQKQDGGGANNAPAQAGMAGAGAAAPMGAASPMGMGGASGAGGHGGQKEQSHSSKYVEGQPVVETPGADLPPPVIGESKKKPKRQG